MCFDLDLDLDLDLERDFDLGSDSGPRLDSFPDFDWDRDRYGAYRGEEDLELSKTLSSSTFASSTSLAFASSGGFRLTKDVRATGAGAKFAVAFRAFSTLIVLESRKRWVPAKEGCFVGRGNRLVSVFDVFVGNEGVSLGLP